MKVGKHSERPDPNFWKFRHYRPISRKLSWNLPKPYQVGDSWVACSVDGALRCGIKSFNSYIS